MVGSSTPPSPGRWRRRGQPCRPRRRQADGPCAGAAAPAGTASPAHWADLHGGRRPARRARSRPAAGVPAGGGTPRCCPATAWSCGRWRRDTSSAAARVPDGAGEPGVQLGEYASCASGRGASAAAPRGRAGTAARRSTCANCASIMRTTELWPSPVLGPSSRNRLGKPATVVPRYACGLPRHTSASVRPSRPRTRSRDRDVGDVESRTEDDRVDLAHDAVAGHDGVRADLADALGRRPRRCAGSARVVVVGEQDPLAAHRVRRREARAAAPDRRPTCRRWRRARCRATRAMPGCWKLTRALSRVA